MKKAEIVAEVNTGKGGEGAEQAIAAMIRQSSEGGQLISQSEFLHRVADQHLIAPTSADAAEEAGALLQKAVGENDDLHELASPDCPPSYYSSNFMTAAYATILFHKKGDPLRLIAEVVRESSALYPRPVPLDIFTQPPFDLAQQEVLDDLERMEEEGYRDIAATTTSTSRVFLYSTLHLEPDHASMLAEWLDVGQFNNP